MRISYIFPQFPVPSQAFAISDIRALQDAGHEVTVHTVKPRRAGGGKPDGGSAVPPGLAVMRPSLAGALRWPGLCWRWRRIAAELAGRIVRGAPRHPLVSITALLALPRCVQIADEISVGFAGSHPDVVHVFWARHGAMVLPVLEAMRSTAIRSAFVGAYDLVADDYLTHLAMERAQVLFTHAHVNRQFVADRAPAQTPLHVIHRGIPIAALGSRSAQAGDVHDHDAPPPMMWITASALDRPKNVEAVIRAFARAEQAGRKSAAGKVASGSEPEMRLEIFGDGPDRARLEALAGALVPSGAVRFRGHVERADLMARMHRAQLFLLLSKKPSERLPNVVKEAMLAGCGIVVSKTEGIEELITDPELGWIVDPDDGYAIDRAISELSDEPFDTAQDRRAAARQIIESRFSTAENMRAYCAAWQQVRAGRMPSGGVGCPE